MKNRISALTIIGGFFWALSGLLIVAGMMYDTSVSTSSLYGGPTEVTNLGKLQTQTLIFNAGLACAVVAALFSVGGALQKFLPLWNDLQEEAEKAREEYYAEFRAQYVSNPPGVPTGAAPVEEQHGSE